MTPQGRRRAGFAVVALLLGAVSMWPRHEAPVQSPEPWISSEYPRGPSDGPPRVAPDRGPPRSGMSTHVWTQGAGTATAALGGWRRQSSGVSQHASVAAVSEGELGVPWLVTRFRWRDTPPKQIRDVASFVGLRPANLADWLAEGWPRAATAALVAEGDWRSRDYSEQWHLARARFDADLGGTTDPDPEAWAAWREVEPAYDPGSIGPLADRLADNRDPWVARVGALYQAEALGSGFFVWNNIPEVQRWALEQLTTDPHPGVLEEAVHHLGSPSLIPVTDAEAALLADLAAAHPVHGLGIASFAASAALAAGDLDAAARWLPTLERGQPLATNRWDYWYGRYDIDCLKGQLFAAGKLEPTTWRDAMQIAAQACASEASEESEHQANGLFVQGAWQLNWKQPDRYTACVDNRVRDSAGVPERQQLLWTVYIHRE